MTVCRTAPRLNSGPIAKGKTATRPHWVVLAVGLGLLRPVIDHRGSLLEWKGDEPMSREES